jgi:hypothetical protein
MGKRIPDIGSRETNNQKIMYNVHSIVRLLEPLTYDYRVDYFEDLCGEKDGDDIHQIMVEAPHYIDTAGWLYVCRQKTDGI